jgi:hypothetical protein
MSPEFVVCTTSDAETRWAPTIVGALIAIVGALVAWAGWAAARSI